VACEVQTFAGRAGQLSRTEIATDDAKKSYTIAHTQGSKITLVRKDDSLLDDDLIIHPARPESPTPSGPAAQQQRQREAYNASLETFQSIQLNLDKVYSHIQTTLGATPESTDWGQQLNAVLLRRDAQLTRFELYIETVAKDLATQRATLELEYVNLRRKLEEDAREKLTADQLRLERELSEQKASLLRESDARNAALDHRTIEVEAREKAADDSDNRAARRKLREKMLSILTERGKEFTLTPETQAKRKPVIWTAGIIAAFFGILLAFVIFQPLSDGELQLETKIAAEITAALGLTGAIIFLLKFTQQWAKRHADEEFYLKRLELDLERASWLVEMSMEYEAERGHPIPTEMFERLSRGLFGGTDSSPDVRHPLETLLDAASEAEVQLPNGKFRIGRRGLQQLAKKSQTPEDAPERQ
jgi:hypothetical protein